MTTATAIDDEDDAGVSCESDGLLRPGPRYPALKMADAGVADALVDGTVAEGQKTNGEEEEAPTEATAGRRTAAKYEDGAAAGPCNDERPRPASDDVNDSISSSRLFLALE